MKEWRRYQPDEVVHDGHLNGYVIVKHFESEDGGRFDFETNCRLGLEAVTLVALTTDGTAIVVKQFRVGPEQVLFELPGGKVDADETVEVAAYRELKEETGYVTDDVVYLGSAHDNAYSNLKRHFLFADNCRYQSEPALDATERVEVCQISINELIANAKSGKMTNGVGVLFAYDELMKAKRRCDETAD